MDETKICVDKKLPCQAMCGISLTVFMKKIDLITNLTAIALLLSESVYSCVHWQHAKDLIFRCRILLNAIGIWYIKLLISRSQLYLLKVAGGFSAWDKKSVGARIALLLRDTYDAGPRYRYSLIFL